MTRRKVSDLDELETFVRRRPPEGGGRSGGFDGSGGVRGGERPAGLRVALRSVVLRAREVT